MTARWFPAAVCVLLSAAPLSARQAPDARGVFVQALGEFSLALEGPYGDEGERIRASLDAMARALDAWDATIRSYEAAMAAERPKADPRLAARMHVALGSVYLDRGRTDDALRAFSEAAELDPALGDAHVLIGLTRSQVTGDLSGAVNALERAAALAPADPVRTYVLGHTLLKAGDSAGAAAAFARFLQNHASVTATQEPRPDPPPFIRLGLVPESPELEPFFPPALYAEGFERLRAGDYPGALTQLRAAAGRDPLAASLPTTGMQRASAAFRDGAVDDAVMHLRAEMAASPGHAEPHRVLGLVYLADERHADAIRELAAAVKLSPADERARIALADAQAAAGSTEDAERTLRDTITALPGSGLAHYRLARLLERQRNHPGALRELESAAASHPLIGANGIYETLGDMHAAGQGFDAAIDAYRTRVDLVPNDPDAHYDLGRTYLRLARHDEALTELTVALMLKPDHVDARVALAQLHLRDGRYDAAIESARRALALETRHEEARYALATALVRSGNADEGAKELEVYKRLQAESAAAVSRQFEIEGLRREAAVATAAGERARAVSLLQRVFVLEPEAASSHFDLGLAHLRAGQHAQAIDRLGTAAALYAPPEVHRHLAEAYAAAGRADDSRRELETYERLRREAFRRRSARR